MLLKKIPIKVVPFLLLITLQNSANGVVFNHLHPESPLFLKQTNLEKNSITIQTSQTFQDQAYDLINDLREKANMIPLRQNDKLEEAAFQHIEYMILNNSYRHEEYEWGDGFIAPTPFDRGEVIGYEPTYYVENFTIGYESSKDSIDALIQSIYHRFGFLDFYIDEIGIAYKYSIYNYNMGNRESLTVTVDRNPTFVVWPPDGYTDAQIVFNNYEEPNPLIGEDCVKGGVTGNPISIQFNPYTPEVYFDSFKAI